jgi:Protein of unknown function (DUF3047)
MNLFFRLKPFLVLVGCSLLISCAQLPSTHMSNAEVAAHELPAWMHHSPWQHQTFPGKRRTQYKAQQMLGREALVADANASLSVMRKKRRIAASELGSVQFSWLAKETIERADMSLRESDDSALRVVLVFEGDRNRFTLKNQLLSELTQTLTGEELPYATLMYVWSNHHPVGHVIHNPRTDRIRKIVVESGTSHLGRWRDYDRDIRADFIQAFGEEPGALAGVALMTDSDNTQSRIKAWYGPVRLAVK